MGVRFLPWVFIGSAACSFVTIFVYSAFADRVPNKHLLVVILGLSAAAIVLGLLFLGGGLFGPAYSLYTSC